MTAHRIEPSSAALPLLTAPDRPRRQLMGVRLDALLEIGAVLALMVVADLLWGAGDRFAQVWPHPFGIVVLLAASYYGTREGLAAAVLSAAVLLLGPMPQGGSDPAQPPLPVPLALQPLIWGIAALIFGEIRDAWRRRAETLREELNELREQTREITQAYHRLQGEKEHLETRVASQVLTVNSMYDAARAIQKQGVGDVLVGVGELVRTVLAPEKFSLFLLNGSKLEATISEGWASDDSFAGEIDDTSPLYRAIVVDRRHLAVSHLADEPILRGEGILAGPVLDSDTGGVVGMLKIEGIRFLDLHPSSVQNFRILCEWIGSALTYARQIEALQPARVHGMGERLLTATEFTADRDTFSLIAARTRMPGYIVYLKIDPPQPDDPVSAARRRRLVAEVARQLLGPHERCYECNEAGWPYAVLLPGAKIRSAQAVAKRLSQRLAELLANDPSWPLVVQRIVSLQDLH